MLGADDFLSKTFALQLDLRPPARSARKRSSAKKIHANNCAVRTGVSSARTLSPICRLSRSSAASGCATSRTGYDYTRTAEAMTVHAPQPGTGSLRGARGRWGWTATTRPSRRRTRSRLGRLRLRVQVLRRQGRQEVGGRILGHGAGRSSCLSGSAPRAMPVILGFYGVGLRGRNQKRAHPKLRAPAPTQAEGPSEAEACGASGKKARRSLSGGPVVTSVGKPIANSTDLSPSLRFAADPCKQAPSCYDGVTSFTVPVPVSTLSRSGTKTFPFQTFGVTSVNSQKLCPHQLGRAAAS